MQAFKRETPDIYADMPVYHGEVYKYSFAALDQCCRKIDAGLSKHGLSFRWKTAILPGNIVIVQVTCILSHIDGHESETVLQAMPDVSGGKNAIQAIGSTKSYLERYTLLSAVGVTTRGMDDDGRQGQNGSSEDGTISDAEVSQVAKLMNEVKADANRFFKYFGIAEVAELKKSQLPKALEELNKKRGSK